MEVDRRLTSLAVEVSNTKYIRVTALRCSKTGGADSCLAGIEESGRHGKGASDEAKSEDGDE